MGSTRVSEVAGIMSIGQGGQTLTGTKEGDLKVQFAEVMSQIVSRLRRQKEAILLSSLR